MIIQILNWVDYRLTHCDTGARVTFNNIAVEGVKLPCLINLQIYLRSEQP